jgi:hypothetical protein
MSPSFERLTNELFEVLCILLIELDLRPKVFYDIFSGPRQTKYPPLVPPIVIRFYSY